MTARSRSYPRRYGVNDINDDEVNYNANADRDSQWGPWDAHATAEKAADTLPPTRPAAVTSMPLDPNGTYVHTIADRQTQRPAKQRQPAPYNMRGDCLPLPAETSREAATTDTMQGWGVLIPSTPPAVY